MPLNTTKETAKDWPSPVNKTKKDILLKKALLLLRSEEKEDISKSRIILDLG